MMQGTFAMNRFAMPILPLLALAVLGSCADTDHEDPAFAGRESAPRFQVEKQERQFVVRTGFGKAEQSGANRSGLDLFLAETAAGNPQYLHVVLRGGSPQAVAAVRQAVIADGVSPTKIEIVPTASSTATGPGGDAGLVTVIAAIYRARVPTCSRRSVDAFSNDQNPSWSDFGCTVNGNLALMVADPHDLIEGEGGGQTDSAIAGAAIDRLMQDKVRKFDTQSFTPLGGSSGGGTQ
jgi:pilus biogenesis lipoprotein CpaD